MARWFMLGLTILGVVLIFTTKIPGVLMLGLLLGVVGFFGFIMALAADRVSASARPESAMAATDDLAALRRRRAPPAARPLPAAAAVPASDGRTPASTPPPATVAGEMRMPDSSGR